MRLSRSLSLLAMTAALVACGGGEPASSNNSAGSSTASLTVNVQNAYAAMVTAGLTKSFTVSGTCTGTASVTAEAAAGSVTFEGKSGSLSAARTAIETLTNCNRASSTKTRTEYYDSNYAPLGYNEPGNSYGIFATAPVIPTAVQIGDTGPIGTQTLYTDNSKATPNGRVDVTYVIEADSARSVIVNLIFKRYDTGNALISTEQNRYRIGTYGPMTLISMDYQEANGSTTHLVYQ